jgi:hypothetical protein
MRRLLAVLLAAILVLGIVGCSNKDVLPTDTKGETEVTEEAAATEEVATEPAELVLADELRVNFALGNNNRTLTYNQATPLTMPSGNVISQGDLKPTWQYIQEQLGFKIVDTTVQDQESSEMIDIAAALSFSDATVFGGSGIAEKLMSYGAQGYFINLKDYASAMPNFTAYIEKNPNIGNAVTAYDGGIYFVPYAAEIGSYARVFNGRESVSYTQIRAHETGRNGVWRD